ncbi:hypothetical protein SODALDRAFT_34706 [Sodiomyces alkalinus F11]|uniref:DUF7514 domain-containing protein n=1 Tax=Sodiomyces alkalinus (strain CBS 110278 / VKM F-3762 / F11) TaxID=1314773 RepID=A0A3N2Q956_SODAK|nr:hypothetical protein SODALDRAFT_34706 [Sodiomyces alkalinus F11]ROT43256.1 hypothetical protein SODALDRAFT_34706 [Sodiomyces alkalinus F11]
MAATTTIRNPSQKATRPVVHLVNTALEPDPSRPRSVHYNKASNPWDQSPLSSETSFETDTDHTDQDDASHRDGSGTDKPRPSNMPSQQDTPVGANISAPLASPSRPASFKRLQYVHPPPPPPPPPSSSSSSPPPPPPPPPPSGFQPPHLSNEVSPALNEELRKIIRQEMAALHSQTHDNSSLPDSVSRITPSTLMSPMFPGAYSSPPPSVTGASTSSRLTSPQSTSPKAPNVSPATTTSSTASPPPPQRATVRFRDRGPAIVHSHTKTEAGPHSPARATAIPETTDTEGPWGVLFDADGYSTQRLGHILRSLASQVIAKIGTTGGITVTPDKMNTLYTKYKVENEDFSLKDAFKPCKKNTFNHIEYLYRDLDCPYHLVQTTPKARPSVPGLTPAGFIKWFTTSMLAYPDQECRRLNRLLADFGPLVIVGADGREERLPKTLPRHVLPASHDKKTRRILDEALMDCLDDHAASSQFASPPSPSSSSSSRPLATPMAPELVNNGRRMSDPDRRHSGPRDRSDRSDRSDPSTRLDTSPDREVPMARISRTQSDNVTTTTATSTRHALPRPPVGRHRPRSPPSSDRYSTITSAPSLFGISSLVPRSRGGGGAGDDAKSVRSWAGRDRESERDRERVGDGDGRPRRRSLVIGGPTWGDFYRNVPTTRVGGSGAEQAPREYHRSR